jgi:hypothetical protein
MQAVNGGWRFRLQCVGNAGGTNGVAVHGNRRAAGRLPFPAFLEPASLIIRL